MAAVVSWWEFISPSEGVEMSIAMLSSSLILATPVDVFRRALAAAMMLILRECELVML